MGITLANARTHTIDEVRRYKENIAVILVSAVFVVLIATLSRDMIAAVDWRLFAFVATVLLVTRPLTVWLSTIGSDMTWREKLLVGWIAPRGIVAVAVTNSRLPVRLTLLLRPRLLCFMLVLSGLQPSAQSHRLGIRAENP